MRRAKHAPLILVLAFLVASCSIVEKGSYVRPATSLSTGETFYVVLDGEGREDTGKLLVERLKALGYDVRGGPRAEVPADTDVIVTYEDHWFWDMSMYMLSVKVDFRNAKTNALLATGQSLRTSLARKSPEAMVDEAISPVLAKGGPMSGGAR